MVFVIGGNGDQERFIDMQKHINNLIRDGCADVDDDDASVYYHQLLNSIKLNDVCFNCKLKFKRHTAQTSINVVFEKGVNDNERQLIVIQHMEMQGVVMLIGVLAFNIKTNKQTFAVNEFETNHQKDQSMAKYKLANDALERFQLHATAFGAVKLENNLALEMLNHGRCLSDQIDKNFFKDQKALTADDQEMYQSTRGHASIDHKVDDDGTNDDF